MKKKFFAIALATTMALSTAISASAETLTGTAWWTGMQTGQDYTLNGNGSVTLSVKVTDGEGPAFSVEAYDPGADGAAGGNDGYYMTCGSDGNIWFAELANGEGVNVTKNPFAAAGGIAAGTIEEVYVNARAKDGSEISELMEIFVNDAVYNDKFPITSGSKRRYKETEEGQAKMCEIMEKIAEEERRVGIEQGEARINTLCSILIDLNRIDDLKRATKDKAFQEQLIAELLPDKV